MNRLMQLLSPLWTPTLEFCAQSCHLGWGAFVVLGSLYHGWYWWVIAVFVAVAAAKEFVFDIVVEQDAWSSSFRDFAFYLGGGLIGYLTWLI